MAIWGRAASRFGRPLPSGSTLIPHPDRVICSPVLAPASRPRRSPGGVLLGAAPAAARGRLRCGRRPRGVRDARRAVYVRKGDLVACHRATGKARVVGDRANDGMGTDEYTAVNRRPRRPLGLDEPARDVRRVRGRARGHAHRPAHGQEGQGHDLRRGHDEQAIALPGRAGRRRRRRGLARFTDGRKQVLGREPAAALAASGARVYWRVQGAVRTAVLQLPAADAAQRPPLARTIGRCRPKRGRAAADPRSARLVVSRAGGATWACLPRRGRRGG